jgi:TetR/AcrR family transcriptional regulator, cholesterol catabolism regulator
LTDAVIEMMAEVDPERLQMCDVAERSGVALATTYRYFSSKDHLLAAAWAAWQLQLTDQVRQESKARLGRRKATAEGSAADRVVAYVHRGIRGFQRHPDFAKLVAHVQACSDPFASEEVKARSADNEEVMLALMECVPSRPSTPCREWLRPRPPTGRDLVRSPSPGDLRERPDAVLPLAFLPVPLVGGAIGGAGSVSEPVRPVQIP